MRGHLLKSALLKLLHVENLATVKGTQVHLPHHLLTPYWISYLRITYYFGWSWTFFFICRLF